MNIQQLNTNNDLPIVHLEFFPSIKEIILFEKLRNVSIDIYENFPKQTFRNRAVVMSSQGLLNIIVPTKNNGLKKTLMKDIEISYSERWNVEAWRTIFSCYGKSPFFIYYEDKVREILFKQYKYLIDLNLETFLFLQKAMNLKCCLNITSHYIDRIENNYRDMLLPKNRVADGADLMPYYQCFETKFEFQTNLSSLDLLFNLGNEANDYIRNAIR